MIAVTEGLIEDDMIMHISVSLECRADIDEVYITSIDGEVFIAPNIVFYPTFLIIQNKRKLNEIYIKYSNICAIEFIIKRDKNG